jgi:hypothetical protein
MKDETNMQIKLSTIVIGMIVAFLLFTKDGNEAIGFVIILVMEPLEELGITLREIEAIVVASILAFIFRNQIRDWWRTRNIGRRIY